MKKEKELKIYSILFIILAAFDVFNLAINYFAGTFSIESIVANGVPENSAKIAVMVVMAIIVLIALLKLYLGLKGLSQANGKVKGTSHITISKIGLFIFAIALIGSILAVIQKTGSVGDLLSSLVALLIIYAYCKDASDLIKK